MFVAKNELKQSSEAEFDPQLFVDHFNQNARRRSRISVASAQSAELLAQPWPTLNTTQKAALRDVIAKLAMAEATEGEMGTKLAQLADSPADRESLLLYVKEEERHGQQFRQVARQLELTAEGQEVGDARGEKLMKLVAKLLNWGKITDVANLMLVGEVISITYYRQLANGGVHPLFSATLKDILIDEAGHVRYHAARTRAGLAAAGKLGKLRFKLVHQFGTLVTLLAAVLLTRRHIQTLTGRPWRELMDLIEQDYRKFFKNDLAELRSFWTFALIKKLPLQ